MLKMLNSKGSTFLTTLVSILIFMIIAGSIISRLENSFKASNFNSAKINEMVGIENLKMHMANSATCQKNLKDKSLSSSGELALPSILDGSGNVLIASGQTTAQGSLFITDIKLNYPAGSPASVIGATPVPAKGFSLPTRVEISFRKEKISLSGKVHTATFDIPVLVDANAKILDCDVASSAFNLSGLCQQIGGTLDSATNICIFPTDCSEKDPTKLASGKCLKEDIVSLKTAISEVQTALATPTPSATPAPTSSPEKVTPAQQQAWTYVEAELIDCINGGANVSAEEIVCKTSSKLFELTPTSGKVGSVAYSDPAVAGYLFKKAQELVLAKFGYK